MTANAEKRAQVRKVQMSQQETIRRMFLKSTRSAIAKKLGIRYQIVFKATNPRYAPKAWQERLVARHETLAAQKAAETPVIAEEVVVEA